MTTSRTRGCKLLLAFALPLLLLGCNSFDRLSEIGAVPRMDGVKDPTNLPGVVPVSMPTPQPSLSETQPNSLWKTGSRAFFRDQRASRVGDILTVVISIDEKAQLSNQTKRSRSNSESGSASTVYGFQNYMKDYMPDGVDPTNLLSTESELNNDGKGSINRSEKISLRVAATIVQILPNGNFVVAGKQQMTVNFDMRELMVSGVVRPEDISSDNTIKYDQIAEARMAYGGRGTIQDVQQPRYGSQVMDILMPF